MVNIVILLLSKISISHILHLSLDNCNPIESIAEKILSNKIQHKRSKLKTRLTPSAYHQNKGHVNKIDKNWAAT